MKNEVLQHVFLNFLHLYDSTHSDRYQIQYLELQSCQ